MDALFQSFLNGFPYLMAHSAAAFVILLLGVRLYMLVTPHDDLALIRQGNVAVSLSLGGTILGMAIPLAFVLAFSVSVLDVVLWGVVTLVLQIIAFFIVDKVLRNLSARLADGDMASAVLLVSVKLTTAAINAAAVSG
jgi:putative membrane protein